ncbi:hypothetical protein EHQ61_11820 [Leptospira wolffii]|nr:hypothetical protein EHQ61_11820 [Leptospira wolffii]
MLQMNRILVLILLLGCLLGCHSTTVVYKSGDTPYSLSKEAPGADKRTRQGSIVMGIYMASNAEEAVCPNSFPEVKMFTGLLDLVIHFFIGPFYTTKTVEVYCRK